MAELDKIVRFSTIPTNGIHLHVAEAGPTSGPLVFLLHGFPEFWYGWRNQISPLSEKGFHIVAPDQRGYNFSDKPKGVGSYDLDQLAADVLGLADHFGQQTFALVGHDWGGSVGWWLASQHGHRMRRFIALNAPHPAVWIHAIHIDPEQKRKSGYVRFFRVPYLPEMLIALDRPKALAKGFRDCTHPNAFTDADLEHYRKAWSQPGALTAMINYYRAILAKRLLQQAKYRVACPTLVIWGRRDAYATPNLAQASVELCASGQIEYFEQSTHWVQHDEPQRVVELVADFLS